MKPRLTGALGVLGVAALLALAGCASGDRASKVVYPIKEVATESGGRVVSVQPYRVSCSQGQNHVQNAYQCPVLGARWDSDRAGVASLSVGIPNLKDASVTGADFHMGASEVVRVRNRSQVQPEAGAYPVTAFDVPLSFVERLAYGPRTWVRVYYGPDRQIDATIRSGEETAQATESLAHFMVAVDQASGRTPSADARRGGLFDRLGLGDGESGSGKGVEGMHPR